MFEQDTQSMPQALLTEFGTEDAASEPVDSFRSELIVAYERAVEEGIHPITVLSAVLDWASQEIKRYSGD